MKTEITLMKCFYSSVKAYFFSFFTILISKTVFSFFAISFIATTTLVAQYITIYPGSNLVLNGNVSLVINNASLINYGTFTAGTSTVDFTGNGDTLLSYVSGINTTSFNNLSVSKSAYGVALKSAVIVKNTLAVNAGNLYTDSNLTLMSDQTLTARVAPVATGSYIVGKANVERYISARRSWRLMTAPVSSSATIFNSWQKRGVYVTGQGLLVTGPNPSVNNGLDASAQNNVSMKTFNYNTQQFVNVVNTKVPISAGVNGSADNTGYMVFVRGDRDLLNTTAGVVNTTTITSIGTLQTGTQTFTASADTTKRYTLIGNPYASPVDFDLVARTNLKKRFYVWDPSLNTVGAYVMLDDLDNDGIYTKSVAGSTQTKHIQSSQAFYVQTTTNGPASITFNESGKSTSSYNQMFKPATTNGLGNGQIVATLNLMNADSTTVLADGALAEFNNDYSAGIDLDDAAKFLNANENISVVRNNVLLAAERRPVPNVNDTLALRITNTSKRAYQLILEASGLEQFGLMAFLEDSYLATSKVISLSGTTTVEFSINGDAASAGTNRFKVVFKTGAVVLPVKITSVGAVKKDKNIAVEWKVENEINMVKYDVEKSADGVTFTYANTTTVTGSNNISNNYSWLDVDPVNGNNFYRIKSYDRSGAVKYSATVKVTMGNIAGGFNVYPTLITGNVIKVVLNNQPAGVYQLSLTNISGQTILVQRVKTSGGNSVESISTGNKLPAGIYQLEIRDTNNKPSTQKLIVE